MTFSPTPLDGVFVIEPTPQRDDRGYLARTYCEKEFNAQGLNISWVQHNHTLSKHQGTIRGMHWQADPVPEIKLVRCLSGKVFDVVVDIRRGSPTFGKWHAEELSSENMRALYIPEGYAHGFQCLVDDCELFYLMSEFYDPQNARGFQHNDPAVAISWPFPARNLSSRDASLPPLDHH